MASKRARSGIVGVVVGIPLMGIAVYSVAFVDWTKEVPPEPPVVRPVKTLEIGAAHDTTTRLYPGTVKAGKEVNLSFQVSGQMIELNVKKGDDVEAGDQLARIDPHDFEQDLAAKQGELTKAKYDFEKINRLFADGNAGRQEVVDAQRLFETSQANMKIAEKALEDTRLVAPFPGKIADRFADNFQKIVAWQEIVALQDVSHVEIVIDVPEERVIRAHAERGKNEYVAMFDYLPGRTFDTEIKEFASEADPATQTYAVTFMMPAPTDVLILPGMTTTIRESRIDPSDGATVFAVPIEVVPVDRVGQYFVWKIEDQPKGNALVHRQDVTVGEMVEKNILVTGGLVAGDRIAAAGVHLLLEGQVVRPLASKAGDRTP